MLRILYIPDTNMQGQKYDTFLYSQNFFQGFYKQKNIFLLLIRNLYILYESREMLFVASY